MAPLSADTASVMLVTDALIIFVREEKLTDPETVRMYLMEHGSAFL